MIKDILINYVELFCWDLFVIKVFFVVVFNWIFIDYGLVYGEFYDKGIVGGLYQLEFVFVIVNGVVLLVFYSFDLVIIQQCIEVNGGVIIKLIFDFFGGRCFYFIELSGNEFVVWSDK